MTNFPLDVFVARIIPSVNGALDVQTFNNNVAAIATNRAGATVRMVNMQTGAGLNVAIGSADGLSSGPDMADNLHPNQDGYDKMADKWKADLLNAGVLPLCQ
jgi:lysophospholipase L1-like esterase